MDTNLRAWSNNFEDPYFHPVCDVIYVEEAFPGTGADLQEFHSMLDLKCDCSDDCKQSFCPCIDEFGQNYVNGLLNDKLLNQKCIVECTSLCACFPFCSNISVQKGPFKHLKVESTADRGYGLFSTETVLKGSFICEYAGEIISEREALKRYNFNKGSNYILLLREYCTGKIIDLYVDASKASNIGRYINHSCSPNCEIVPVRVGSPIPKIAIFANRLIKQAEEITYSYGSSTSNLSKTPCLCGSSNCRGYLPQEMFGDDNNPDICQSEV